MAVVSTTPLTPAQQPGECSFAHGPAKHTNIHIPPARSVNIHVCQRRPLIAARRTPLGAPRYWLRMLASYGQGWIITRRHDG